MTKLIDAETEVSIPLHIAIQVHINPAASAEQIDEIFAALARHLSDVQRRVDVPREQNKEAE